MTEQQRLFLVQARSGHVVFERLRGQGDLPACHALHYLQMSTELLGKAYLWRSGPQKATHKAFVRLLQSLASDSEAQAALGHHGRRAEWRTRLRSAIALADEIERLAPALAGEGVNVEYPWPRTEPTTAPAEFEFPLWRRLTEAPRGRSFLRLIEQLFNQAERFL